MSYGYKGLAGAVTSVAPAATLLASVAEDRFLRLHSTHAPPAQAGGQQERKGEVLDRLYMQVKPTVVLWDGQPDVRGESGSSAADDVDSDGEGDDDGVWDKMEDVESDEEAEGRKKSRQR